MNEPEPVPTEAQKKVREAIASTVRKEELKKPPSTENKDVPLDHQAPASQQPNPNTQPPDDKKLPPEEVRK